MERSVLNKLSMLIYFIVGAIVLEFVTYQVLQFSSMPQYFLYNFALIAFIALVVYVIPSFAWQYGIYTGILFVQTVFAYINYSLKMIYGDVFSFDMINLALEAGAAISKSFVYFAVSLQLISVFLIITILGAVLLNKIKKEKINPKEHFSIFNVIVLIALECFSLGYVMNVRNSVHSGAVMWDNNNYFEISDSFVMDVPLLKSCNYENFGTYGYFANLMIRQINGYDQYVKDSAVKYFNDSSIYDGSLYKTANGEVKDKNGNLVSFFGVDKNKETQKRNNVIVIMMESLEWFAFGDGTYDKDLKNLSNELTPNIYNLIYGETTEGLAENEISTLNYPSLISNNFFAKSKTNISEGYGIIGNYPVSQTLKDVVDGNVSLTYAMPNVLKNFGYTTNYIHSNEISFYDRNITHSKLGFDNVIGKDLVTKDGHKVYTEEDLKWGHWENEAEFVRNTMDYIVPNPSENSNPFYSFYLNVSSHGEYRFSEFDRDCLRYENFVKYGADDCVFENGIYRLKTAEELDGKELDYSTWYQNIWDEFGVTGKDLSLCNELLYYQCGVCGLDEAIGEIIKQLKEYNLQDETTIVLYSDHYAYYSEIGGTTMSERFKNNPQSYIELNTIPFIISSPGLKNLNNRLNKTDKVELNSRFCSAYDIVPTLYDLLGIKFNENLYFGQSIFKPAKFVYNLNGEVFEMFVYYSNTNGIFSKHMYTYNFKDYFKESIYVSDEIVEIFNEMSYEALHKLNNLYIVNKYQLYKYIDFVCG